ncbi:MAG: protein kinase, partial [Planctomycetota bacterium]|nr:protein kinase [Planctomycetota bacterium]
MSSAGELPVELDRLAREFVARERAGEHPTISEYVRRYPEYEDGIREVFPMLAVMEGVKPASGSGSLTGVRALDPGVRRLGDYRLLRVVGRGGMGVVYEAEQATLGRRVALKVLPPQATMDTRFVERFRIEAQAAARLQHPNIVPVIGLGEDDGVHYYAMQFIDGCGLDEVMEETRALLDASADDAPSSGSGAAARLFAVDLDDGSSAVGTEPAPAAAAPEPVPVPVDPGSRAGRRRYRMNVVRIALQAAEALAFAHARGVLHRDIKPSNIMLDGGGRAWIADFGLCRQEESDGLTRTG